VKYKLIIHVQIRILNKVNKLILNKVTIYDNLIKRMVNESTHE